MAITLAGIVNTLNASTNSRRWWLERLGGNVYGVTDYSGVTVTIDGGRREARGPASVLVCLDGASIGSADDVSSVDDVVALTIDALQLP